MTEMRLLDVCNVYQPKTIAAKSLRGGLYSVYGANGIVGYHTDYNHEESEVVMGCRGSCGCLCITKPFSWINGNAMVIKPNGTVSIDKKYLLYALMSKSKNDIITGTANPQITRQNLKDFTIPICEKNEQDRIVENIEAMFSQLDGSVETLKKTKQQLAVYRQAVLKEAFTGLLTENWRSSHKENLFNSWLELLAQYKEQSGNNKTYKLESNISLPEIPSSWKWIFVGDISSGTEYGTSKKSEKEGKIPVIRMGNLQNGLIDWDGLAYTSDEKEIQKYMLSTGDVLFNRTNSPELVGKTAIYNGEREAIFAGYLIRINQYDCVNPKYLNYFMNGYIAKQYGNKVKTDGVNQSNINGKKLCSYPFPACTSEEQEQVVYELESRLSMCDDLEQTVNLSLQQTEALRQSILKQAFEGTDNN